MIGRHPAGFCSVTLCQALSYCEDMTHGLPVARPSVLLVAVLALLLTACDPGAEEVTRTPSTTATTAEAPPSEVSSTPDPTEDDPTTGPTDGPTATEQASDDEFGPTADEGLPGEPFDSFPVDGAELAVVGVAADDTLNVRSGPGVTFDVVTELDPLAVDLVSTGRNQMLDSGGIWSEITADGVTGWANTRFLTHLGLTEDSTSRLFPSTADRLSADTMVQLGQLVGEQVRPAEGEGPASRIVVVDGPTVGDLGEITVDVIGLGDDAANGTRLRIFAEPVDEGFTVRTVEQTAHCTRGVTDDGLCV
jgi:hypothetical protein